MDIAIVSPYSWAHPGGVNNHIEGLARELGSRGHHLTVIAPDAPARSGGPTMVTAGRSVPMPANGSIARIAIAPGTGARVRRALQRGAFDVVHVHEPMVPLVSTSAVAGAKGRVVATFHSAGEGSAVYWLASKALKGLASRIDARVAVSQPARSLASRYLPGDYEIIPNGVDIGRFREAATRARAPEGQEILFVGRNEPRKGLAVLLEAFEEICGRVPDARLKIIGSGVTPAAISSSVPSGLRGRVAALGFVPNEDLPEHYASADVFCAPALGGESFGIVLVEAMAAGTPVVASDIPGYSAVLQQAGGGMLFRSGDPSDLAGKLAGLLLDEALRSDLAAAGSEGVEQFSWEVLAPRLEAVYSG